MLNIILFGPPGVGKGTQSKNLVKKYKLHHLSTGHLLRSEIKTGTSLGLETKSLIDAGKLVPDDVVAGMICQQVKCSKNTRGFIFDGFPRTEEQAKALDRFLSEIDESITIAIVLGVPEEELIRRLLERGKNSDRTDDQNEEIIKKRLETYEEQTEILKKYYRKQDKFHSINGFGKVLEVFDKLKQLINKDKAD